MHTWAPRWSVVIWSAVAGVVLLAVAHGLDVPGEVLAVAAAVACFAFAAFDGVVRPTLTADANGLTVRTGGWPRRYPWAEITRVEVVTTRRLLVLHALEIDAGDDLLLLTRRRLGTDLREVAEALAEFGAPVR